MRDINGIKSWEELVVVIKVEGERERSNLVYLALVNFSSGLIELSEWNVAIIFHPPCACFFLFLLRLSLSTILTGKINLYSH